MHPPARGRLRRRERHHAREQGVFRTESRGIPEFLAMSNRSRTPAPAGGESKGFDARVLGESDYDRVISLLMAVVMGALMIVGVLGLFYVTTQAYASRVTAPLEIVEVFGGGG